MIMLHQGTTRTEANTPKLEAVKQLEIEREFAHLAVVIGELGEELRMLEARLSPVLMGADPVAEEANSSRASMTEFGGVLEMRRLEIDHLRLYVSNLRGRLAL